MTIRQPPIFAHDYGVLLILQDKTLPLPKNIGKGRLLHCWKTRISSDHTTQKRKGCLLPDMRTAYRCGGTRMDHDAWRVMYREGVSAKKVRGWT